MNLREGGGKGKCHKRRKDQEGIWILRSKELGKTKGQPSGKKKN